MATKRVRLPDRPPSEGFGSTPLTIELAAEQPFLPTREQARFVEFAEACSRYRYIGICHYESNGSAGCLPSIDRRITGAPEDG